MGRLFLEFVDDDAEGSAKYVCCSCGCDIASEASLLWEGYMGACTPALLFRHAVNVEPSAAEREEVLSTGRYTLADVRCRACCITLGWQYLAAESRDQQYKVGAVLLQQAALEFSSPMQQEQERGQSPTPPQLAQAQY